MENFNEICEKAKQIIENVFERKLTEDEIKILHFGIDYGNTTCLDELSVLIKKHY